MPVPACSGLWEDAQNLGVTPIDFALSPDQEAVREAIAKICARFDEDYWLKRDREGGFPHDFHQALAAGGWLGIAMPEEYGGSGLRITQAAPLVQASPQAPARQAGALPPAPRQFLPPTPTRVLSDATHSR